MPFTMKLDDQFSVTISSDPLRRDGWEAVGQVYNTLGSCDTLVTVRGAGRTLPAAEDRALVEARRWCRERRMKR